PGRPGLRKSGSPPELAPSPGRMRAPTVTLLLGRGANLLHRRADAGARLGLAASRAAARTPRRSHPEDHRTLMIVISAQGLGRQYSGDPVFMEVAFEVRAGERIGLVGPNGAGKTTLMQILSGRDQPDYGNLYVRPGIRVSLLRQEPDF